MKGSLDFKPCTTLDHACVERFVDLLAANFSQSCILCALTSTKYGSPLQLDAQIVALCAHCARTALRAPPR